MWHYTEGIHNWDPIWPMHGIRILPGPSSLWLDATGKRLPVPLFPGFDTLGTLAHIMRTGHDHTWFVLTQKIIEKEFALSGSEQNPDITGREHARGARGRASAPARPAPVEAFKDHGADFVVERDLRALVRGHERAHRRAAARPRRARARDRRPRPRDRQPVHEGPAGHRDPRRAPLPRRPPHPRRGAAPPARPRGRAADRRASCTSSPARRSAGCRPTSPAACCRRDGEPLPGLYAAGEVAGFGGGGMHGYRALEGTFLGGCLFSGRTAGRAAAAALA